MLVGFSHKEQEKQEMEQYGARPFLTIAGLALNCRNNDLC